MLALTNQPRTFELTAPQMMSMLVQPNAHSFRFDVFVHTETSNSHRTACHPSSLQQYACDRWKGTKTWRIDELEAAVRAAYSSSASTVRFVHIRPPGSEPVLQWLRWHAVLREADAVRRYYDVYLFCRMDIELTAPLRVAELLARGRAWRARHVSLTSSAQRDDFLYCVTGMTYNRNSFIHQTDTDYFYASSRRCAEALATVEGTELDDGSDGDGGLAAWRAKMRNVTLSKRTLDRWRNATGLKPDKPYLLHSRDGGTTTYYRRHVALLQEGCGFDVRTTESMHVRAEMVRPGGVRGNFR